eukprot:4387898-Prymnesium_polylepis.1
MARWWSVRASMHAAGTHALTSRPSTDERHSAIRRASSAASSAAASSASLRCRSASAAASSARVRASEKFSAHLP